MVDVKKTRTPNVVFALVLPPIILLSIVFHYQVHFENALIQSPAHGIRSGNLGMDS